MVCDERLEISEEETLRYYSLLFDNNDDELNKIAIKVSYLGIIESYEENLVQVDVLENFPVIFFNDFIIQVYNNADELAFLDFYGINKEDMSDFNINSDKFIFQPLLDENKVKFQSEYFKPIIEKNCSDLISIDIELINRFCRESEIPVFPQDKIEEILKELNDSSVFTLFPEKRYKTLSKILISKIKK